MNTPNKEFTLNQSSGLNFKDIYEKLLKSWPFLLVSVVLSLGVAYWYLNYKSVPSYMIKSQLLIDNENQKGSSSQKSNINILLGSQSTIDNEVVVLKTRSLMEKLVVNNMLYVSWFKKEKFRDAELSTPPFDLNIEGFDKRNPAFDVSIKKVDENRFDIRYPNSKTREEEQATFTFDEKFQLPGYGSFLLKNRAGYDAGDQTYLLKISSVGERAAQLSGALTAAVNDERNTIIDLSFTYALPDRGEYILNKFIEEYIKQNMQDKSRIADSTVAFIDQRILMVNSELNGIERNIQTFMQGSGLANISEQSKLLLTNSSENSKKISELDNRIEIVNSLNEALNQEGTKRIVAGSMMSEDVAFNTLVASYNSLNLDRERLLLSYTPDNPYVTNIDQRIERVRQNILGYLANTKNNLQLTRSELSKSSGKIRGDIKAVPAQERAFLDLSRQQQLKQELYLFLLQKREEAAVSNTSNLATIRVIDPPKSDAYPFSPKPSVIYLVALMVGIAIPLGSIYLRSVLKSKVESSADVKQYTQVPIIAEIGHSGTAEMLIDFNANRSMISEQFRSLRTNLQFLLTRSSQKIIMITSAVPGEGKSFISMNLAQACAISGKKVLLVEFDLRRPKISKFYAADKERSGLSKYIVDTQQSIDQVIHPVTDNPFLFLATCGHIPPNPSELIVNDRVRYFFEQARERFDLVIVDAPPIGVVTDAQLLSNHADSVLFITREGYSPIEALDLLESHYQDQKLKNVGLVLNDVKKTKKSYYGDYYTTEEKKSWWRKSAAIY